MKQHPAGEHGERPHFRAYRAKDLENVPQVAALSPTTRLAMKTVATVLPFRVNQYVVDELIDWSSVPDDPMFQLTFPQRDMLDGSSYARMEALVREGASPGAILAAARTIQAGLNPHPAGQVALNVPTVGGRPIPGIQHKYRETVLFFPGQGQTCHAYCTYCFRWPQFVGLDELKFASLEAASLVAYLREHPEVTSVLITGGDPMVMKTTVLARYIDALLAGDLPQLASIRLGTKAVAYWPHRFVTDDDADDLLRLFEKVVASGRTLALMAHYSHPRELSTDVARLALRRIVASGAVVRCQSPIIHRVNDDAATWSELWRTEVQLGAVPYYMFIARDTGARRYFEVPLGRAWEVFREAYASVSGLARTVRGPSMSATPGKVCVDGVARVAGEDVFALRLLQARDPAWVGRPFHARFDPRAAWLDDLVPAFDEPSFFYDRATTTPTPSRRPRRALPVVADDEAA
jgi:L-lysine 2,3-aminomutase